MSRRSQAPIWLGAVISVGAMVTACGGGGDGIAVPPVAQNPAPTFAKTCADLSGSAQAQEKITAAEALQNGSFQASASSTALTGLPEFCRVAATLTPTPDSKIDVEVWMPKDWNGRFLGTGNDGFAGRIVYQALADGLKRGFAVANTDLGTSNRAALVGRPEMWIDFGHRATHLMTTFGKRVVNTLYQKAPSYSYFHGCSTGGGQGFHEAQQYPGDYNGIVAGAPGQFRTGVHIGILWNYLSTRGDQNLSAAKLTLLNKGAVAACDKLDGVADGIIGRPDLCKFDPAVLQCTGADDDTCLTAAQVKGAKQIYAGVLHKLTGQTYYDGMIPGSETGGWNVGISPPSATNVPLPQIFQTVFGPSWTAEQFDFGADIDTMDWALGPMVNAMSPDLSAFQKAGGKIIHWHGMSDGVLAYTMSQKYWDSVNKQMPGESQKFARMISAPGVNHCGGGAGPDAFGGLLSHPFAGDPKRDLLTAVQAWVEQGTAPDGLITTKFVNGDQKQGVQLTRPLCAYPNVLKYNGTGDPNNAASFSCGAP
ncbi:tannase/feruloyl esterase family alpha/beta hydrolase [Variovorax paradoxus]|nr:tannase/feruloyl esterase family alpha/beta hydrolase [Variovorax paradoxus]MBT2302501.1 tannase/feruloyl esterase family alpha/beta hydrolase [Variovorax paradoxus]